MEGNRNLVPVVVVLAPILGCPPVVQVDDGSVLFSQPVVKILLCPIIGRTLRILVVDLPSNYGCIVAKTLRKPADDVAAEFSILWVVEVVLEPVAMFVAAAVVFHAQRLRIFLCEPCRRRSSGSAQHNVDAMFASQIDGAIYPVEIVVTISRLQPAPGKFTDAHYVNVSGLH